MRPSTSLFFLIPCREIHQIQPLHAGKLDIGLPTREEPAELHVKHETCLKLFAEAASMSILKTTKKAIKTGFATPGKEEVAALVRHRKSNEFRFHDGLVPNHPSWPLVFIAVR
ncbi:hypothetical protein [Mesorhizobium sp. 113-3-3]|uniref:hypothetical protein n=1 Tax=Mesorhizobium sp. 113-3-3 TaxID=2744516 RepID=UPI001FD3CF1C|nr:hypothetical protein [Mesorhizobium sp. 113-3-3]